MTWFRVDDTFAMHEKVVEAGNAAIGLWTRAGAWSMQQLTDGFVPNHVVRVLGTPKERRTLVEVSLWEEAEEGIQFRNWEGRQPTKEQVISARQAANERQRHAREAAKSRRDSRRDSQESNGVSHGPPDPTRPDQEAKASSERPRKRACRLPDEWMPDDQVRQTMITELPDLDFKAEHAKFTDHWHAKAGKDATKLDWNATWRNWMRRASEYGAKPGKAQQPGGNYFTAPPPPDDMPSHLFAAWNRAHATAHKQGNPGPQDWHELQEAS